MKLPSNISKNLTEVNIQKKNKYINQVNSSKFICTVSELPVLQTFTLTLESLTQTLQESQ